MSSKNGSRVWLETTYRHIAEEDKGRPGIVRVSRDITGKNSGN
jgi:PAS domain S-box-containing protein